MLIFLAQTVIKIKLLECVVFLAELIIEKKTKEYLYHSLGWERLTQDHWDHRIIEGFGLEGTFKIIWFQPPCHEQGHLPLDQVAQSSIQPGLEHCQGGSSHSFSGQRVQCFTTLMVKNFFLISNLNLPSFSLQPFPLVLSLHTLVKWQHHVFSSPYSSFWSMPPHTHTSTHTINSPSLLLAHLLPALSSEAPNSPDLPLPSFASKSFTPASQLIKSFPSHSSSAVPALTSLSPSPTILLSSLSPCSFSHLSVFTEEHSLLHLCTLLPVIATVTVFFYSTCSHHHTSAPPPDFSCFCSLSNWNSCLHHHFLSTLDNLSLHFYQRAAISFYKKQIIKGLQITVHMQLSNSRWLALLSKC